MGGIQVDLRGRSSVPGLWACGEVAAAGIHGANRLASNSLLEAVVFAPRVAADILASDPVGPVKAATRAGCERLTWTTGEERIARRLQRLAYDALGLVREEQSLQAALHEILRLENRTTARPAALSNRLTVLKLLAVTALNRRESRGGHFRADYPETRDAFDQRTITTLTQVDIQAAAIAAAADNCGMIEV